MAINPTNTSFSTAFTTSVPVVDTRPVNDTDQTLDTANKFIKWLSLRTSSCIEVCLTAYNHSADSAGKALSAVNTVISKAGLASALGGIVGQTLDVFAAFDPKILPSEIEKVVDLLKSTNRLYQIGSGKGKGLILLTVTPVTAAEYVEKSIGANDVIGLSKALKDAVVSIVADNKSLRKQLVDLQTELRDKESMIVRLNSDLSSKYKTTWT